MGRSACAEFTVSASPVRGRTEVIDKGGASGVFRLVTSAKLDRAAPSMAAGHPRRRSLKRNGMTALDRTGTGSSQNVRVAILGGGAGALAAAYGLIQQGSYDITVYQMGWRLGGKGASGRRVDDGSGRDQGTRPARPWRLLSQRHGHVGGRSIRPGRGLRPSLGLRRRLHPHSLVHIVEDRPDGRFPVRFPFPENDKPFGCDPSDLPLVSVAGALLPLGLWLKRLSAAARRPRERNLRVTHAFLNLLQSAIQDLSPPALESLGPDSEFQANRPDVGPLDQALDVIQASHLVPPPPNAEHDPDYGILFKSPWWWPRGIAFDGLWRKGFDAANGEEFAAWMTRHRLSQHARGSSFFRCGYDYAFAYVDGDCAKSAVAAGAALRGFLRMLLTYNRSVFAHMNGGMGEIVFAPLYEVLKSRGVKFEFFHRVDSLELDADGTRLDRVVGVVQNRPVAASYDPLLLYNNERWCGRTSRSRARLNSILRCRTGRSISTNARGPNRPRQRPSSLHRTAISMSASWPFRSERSVRSATTWPVKSPHGAPCSPSPRRRRRRFPPSSGCPRPPRRSAGRTGPPSLTANRPSLSTWADMSFLLPLERPSTSRHLSYFCGPCPRNVYAIPPSDSTRDPLIWRRAARTRRRGCGTTLTAAAEGRSSDSFASADSGDELYVRVNGYPSDSYVLTLPGTVEHRLPPGGSGVTNLFLAGDWTKNGLDIGSFETAVLSGLECARAITGTAERFPGENDVVG